MPITSKKTASQSITPKTAADGIETGSNSMKQSLGRLHQIESQMEAIGDNIRREGQVYQAELEERLRLGLQGAAAIRHYNEWMKRHNMSHLMVKEN